MKQTIKNFHGVILPQKLSETEYNFIIEENSYVTIIIPVFTSADIHISVQLQAENTVTSVYVPVIGYKSDTFSIITNQSHNFPNTKSIMNVRSILTDQTKFTYSGLIHAGINSDGTDAYQRNENLVVSDTVHVDSSPKLEIESSNLRCTHGVSTGNISETELEYLASRGISRHKGIKLIAFGFLRSYLDDIDSSDMHQLIADIKTHLDKIIT